MAIRGSVCALRYSSRMRRRALQIIVLLLLGAIVNVAVAIGVSCFAPELVRSQTTSPTDVERQAWRENAHEEIRDFHLFSSTTYTIGTAYRKRELSAAKVDQNGFPLMDRNEEMEAWRWSIHAGFPCTSLHGEFWAWRQGRNSMSGWLPKGRIFLLNSYTFLPLNIRWPGFAINTIFYAAILWVLFAVPLALRRRRRLKRGQCPACAYPIGTSEVCTECGKSI
jgi:hypothetical protein